MPEIHSTAIVEDGAELADDVQVGPFCFVGRHVRVGPGTRVHQGALIKGRTTIGSGNSFFPYSVVGTIPQDLKYQGEPSELEIGDRNTFREYVTVNIGTSAGGSVTRIGNDNLLMTGSHVGHDCEMGTTASCPTRSGSPAMWWSTIGRSWGDRRASTSSCESAATA